MLPLVHALSLKRNRSQEQHRQSPWNTQSRVLVLGRQLLQLCWCPDTSTVRVELRSSLHNRRQLLSEKHLVPLFQVLLLPECRVHYFRQPEPEGGKNIQYLQRLHCLTIHKNRQIRYLISIKGRRRKKNTLDVRHHVPRLSQVRNSLFLSWSQVRSEKRSFWRIFF